MYCLIAATLAGVLNVAFPVESNHDSGAKTLLGQTIPAGGSAEADLAAAFNIVFNHPNIGPFVATQMIEHLVTSNPSPAYVQRVATAFATGWSRAGRALYVGRSG